MKGSLHQGTGDPASDPALELGGMVNLSRLSVLVADPEAAQSRRTLDLLAGLDVRDVVCARDRGSALEWLRSRAFDLMLCASRLGADDGLELIRQARQISPATRSVLIRPHSRAAQPEGVATLERPFSGAKLQALLSRSAAPLGGLWCEVPELSLADILQLYHQGRRSITVLLSGPIAGRIRLVGGELVHAESGNLQGLAALSRLLEADSGLLRTETSALDGPRTLEGPFESTVLAALQHLDERRRDRTSASTAAPLQPPIGEQHGIEPPQSAEFSEELPPAPAKRGWPLILALGSALTILAVASLLLVRSIAARSAAQPKAGDPVRSEVLGLAPQPAPTPQPQPLQPPAATAPGPNDSEAQKLEDAPVPPAPTRFELTITSKPSRANVRERGKLIGKTPLTLSIERASVARAPREFVLEHRGHAPRVFRQGDSGQNVRATVALKPLKRSATDVLDLGDLDESSPAKSGARRTRRSRPRLDIRLRR